MKKIIVIGLPYFARKIATELKKVDINNNYIALNTYYSFVDKLKLLFLLPFSKTLYSINGTISKSLAFTYALSLKKRIVMHWVGSDILSAKNCFAKNKYRASYINKCIHLTDTPWFVNELAKLGINALYIPLINFESKDLKNISFPVKFKVLIYISENNQIFYGIKQIANVAIELSDIEFHIIGTKNPVIACPSNMFFHGWVENVENYILDAVVCIRIPEHDGLSFFVLESLFYKRYVLYNQPLPCTEMVQNDNDIITKLKHFKHKFDANQLSLNEEASMWVKKQFSEKNIIELKKILTNEQ